MNTMTPYDGSGYGHSIYWRNQMKELAKKNGEACNCWSENEPLMEFKGEGDFEIIIECQEKKQNCVQEFQITQRELLAKFKNFHKV